jgi:hypothetical protein
MLRTVLAHKTGQCVDRSKSLVAGRNHALTRLFQIGEKETHKTQDVIETLLAGYGSLGKKPRLPAFVALPAIAYRSF